MNSLCFNLLFLTLCFVGLQNVSTSSDEQNELMETPKEILELVSLVKSLNEKIITLTKHNEEKIGKLEKSLEDSAPKYSYSYFRFDNASWTDEWFPVINGSALPFKEIEISKENKGITSIKKSNPSHGGMFALIYPKLQVTNKPLVIQTRLKLKPSSCNQATFNLYDCSAAFGTENPPWANFQFSQSLCATPEGLLSFAVLKNINDKFIDTEGIANENSTLNLVQFPADGEFHVLSLILYENNCYEILIDDDTVQANCMREKPIGLPICAVGVNNYFADNEEGDFVMDNLLITTDLDFAEDEREFFVQEKI